MKCFSMHIIFSHFEHDKMVYHVIRLTNYNIKNFSFTNSYKLSHYSMKLSSFASPPLEFVIKMRHYARPVYAFHSHQTGLMIRLSVNSVQRFSTYCSSPFPPYSNTSPNARSARTPTIRPAGCTANARSYRT